MIPTLIEYATELKPLNEDLGPGTAIPLGFARENEKLMRQNERTFFHPRMRR